MIIQLLGTCCVCNKIRISDNPETWISRDENSNLYDLFINEFELTHGYCPKHLEEEKEKIKEYQRIKSL